MKNRLLNCLRFFYTKFEMNAKTLKVFFLSWAGKKNCNLFNGGECNKKNGTTFYEYYSSKMSCLSTKFQLYLDFNFVKNGVHF